ncbi:ATP-binding protein [Streptomyces sp. NPDC088725]|uniref:ATP-binding protein n=1 Tax=Streptomyces sp. NPDC088725 TaxID=3365873 RepID=UPI003812FE35
MSLPLTRRIARAALLIAAGAAPVVGAAGSAGAATLPQTADLGALTALDGAHVGDTIDSGAQQATKAAGGVGGKVVGTAIPAAGKTVGQTAKTVTPAAQKMAGDTAGSAGEVLGQTATSAAGAAPASPLGGLSTDSLPLKGLPIG